DAGAQRLERHALDALERAQYEVAVRGPRRRNAEAAVADDHRGDPVPGRDREPAVPEELRVVVRVDVDEARRDDRPLRHQRSTRRPVDPPERDDGPVADAEVAPPRRRAGAIDERAAADDEIEVGHVPTLLHPAPAPQGTAALAPPWRIGHGKL